MSFLFTENYYLLLLSILQSMYDNQYFFSVGFTEILQLSIDIKNFNTTKTLSFVHL